MPVSVRRSTFGVRRSAFGVRRSAFGVLMAVIHGVTGLNALDTLALRR
jgi:hypothetical protein